MGFTFQPEDPVGEAFNENALAGNAITASTLVDTPLNKWDAVVEDSGPPSDLGDLRRNLNNELSRSSHSTSHLYESYVGKVARGGFDGAINKQGIDGFTDSQIPSSVKLEGYKELFHEIYEEAQGLNEKFKGGDINSEQLEQGIDQLMDYKDQQLEKLGNDYESQINKTLDVLENAPAQVQPVEQGVKPVTHAI